MRKVILMMSVSLDGYVAREDHDLSWMLPRLDDESQEWILELLRRADTQLMGRVSYDEQSQAWPGTSGETGDLINGATKIIFSHTLEKVDWEGARLADLDPAGEIARLREEPGGDIFVPGGANLARGLSSAGLIDEYRLILHPVVLGRGLPLFGDELELTLDDTTMFASGAMGLVYTPAK
jgi:dihydrofolate reductase